MLEIQTQKCHGSWTGLSRKSYFIFVLQVFLQKCQLDVKIAVWFPWFYQIFCKMSTTVDSCYLDPSYLDPITYVELISKSRLFSLCIYCISTSRMSNYFYVDTSAILSIIFNPWIYFSQFLLPRISNLDHDEGKKCKMRRRRSRS